MSSLYLTLRVAECSGRVKYDISVSKGHCLWNRILYISISCYKAEVKLIQRLKSKFLSDKVSFIVSAGCTGDPST